MVRLTTPLLLALLPFVADPTPASRALLSAPSGEAARWQAAGVGPRGNQEKVLTHREQAPLIKDWIVKRFDRLLPELMRREKIDMWIVLSREYNDDPVFRSMAPLTTYSSRR